MKNGLLFETFDEFCERAEEILEAFKKAVLVPSFSLHKYKEYIYNKHSFCSDAMIDQKAKDKCWVWLMSYKYEKVSKNDLYCVLGSLKKAQLKNSQKYDKIKEGGKR